MKINILFEFKDGPWGGGNQFLKALKKEFIKIGVYEENQKQADVILFNSHHNLKKILKLKLKYPNKKFIHRIDGPIFLIRNRDLEVDRLIFKFSEKIADFSIFQSQWSFKQCTKLGFKNNPSIIIHNAPDNSIFNTNGKYPLSSSGKIRLIATSWSGNKNKGFETYKNLDKNLDFNKYEFVFVGNSPVEFKNIKHIQPLPSQELAKELKRSDIFLTASQKDPCSNSLIEALSCGLPAVVFNDGGHPELIQKGGEIFNTPDEAVVKIELVSINYRKYREAIPKYTIEQIAKKYIYFLKNTYAEKKSKRLNFIEYLFLLFNIYLIKFKSFLK